ncbi:hypothetical protein CDL62_03605 [Alkalitalea saponilacus]|uniref:Uncharacterized protein n=1 Tax=Alkalitalea saponilacus TaxID=889453 RepID=A0A1T5HS37_9BACT|nr:hypothetical protein CDL62_03605 [Alkalitalea saponilacus]SKC23514.1 hypothetical protein SAMN03080601_02789 [Alkalitalea saponilacus]
MNCILKKDYHSPRITIVPCDFTITLLGESSPPPFPSAFEDASPQKANNNSPFRDRMFEKNPLDSWND